MFLSIQDNENDAVILLYNSDRMCYIVRKKYEGKRKMNRGQAKGAKLRERLIGDKAFYAEVVAVVVPIIIQNTVSNVVSLLDNVMVGARRHAANVRSCHRQSAVVRVQPLYLRRSGGGGHLCDAICGRGG